MTLAVSNEAGAGSMVVVKAADHILNSLLSFTACFCCEGGGGLCAGYDHQSELHVHNILNVLND